MSSILEKPIYSVTRLQTISDTRVFCYILEYGLKESPLTKDQPIDLEVLDQYVSNHYKDPTYFFCIGQLNGRPHGVWMGQMVRRFFNSNWFAFEHLVYVCPKSRASRLVYVMGEAFKQWAFDNGCDAVHVGLTIDHGDSALRRLGMHPVGRVFQIER